MNKERISRRYTFSVNGVAVWQDNYEDIFVESVIYQMSYTNERPSIKQMWITANESINGKLYVDEVKLSILLTIPISGMKNAYRDVYRVLYLDIPSCHEYDGYQIIHLKS
jgi:hypothetical protein